MRLKILPYKMASEGARDIAHALNVKRVRPNGSFRAKVTTLLFNWGNSSSRLTPGQWVNKPSSVALAINKLTAFNKFKEHGVSIPEFTTDKAIAERWRQSGHKVVLRQKLQGTNGEGIVIAKPEDSSMASAPLYVKYQKKDKEYRVHVFNRRVIDIAEKRKKAGFQTENPYIRNLQNGWVYCREAIYPSDLVKNESIKAVRALGLDFGAVDVIEKSGKVYILEINTSPGLQGSTLTKYVNAIKETYGTQLPSRRYRNY